MEEVNYLISKMNSKTKKSTKITQEDWQTIHRKIQKKTCKNRTDFEYNEHGLIRQKRFEYKHILTMIKLMESLQVLCHNGRRPWETTRAWLANNSCNLKEEGSKPVSQSTIRNRLNLLKKHNLITITKIRDGIKIAIPDISFYQDFLIAERKRYRAMVPYPQDNKTKGDKLCRTGGQIMSDPLIGTLSTEDSPLSATSGSVDKSTKAQELEQSKKVVHAVIKRDKVLSMLANKEKKSAFAHLLQSLDGHGNASNSVKFAYATYCAKKYVLAGTKYGFDDGPRHPIFKAGSLFNDLIIPQNALEYTGRFKEEFNNHINNSMENK